MLSLVVLYSHAQLMVKEQLHMVGMILLEGERMVLDNEKNIYFGQMIRGLFNRSREITI